MDEENLATMILLIAMTDMLEAYCIVTVTFTRHFLAVRVTLRRSLCNLVKNHHFQKIRKINLYQLGITQRLCVPDLPIRIVITGGSKRSRRKMSQTAPFVCPGCNNCWSYRSGQS